MSSRPRERPISLATDEAPGAQPGKFDQEFQQLMLEHLPGVGVMVVVFVRHPADQCVDVPIGVEDVKLLVQTGVLRNKPRRKEIEEVVGVVESGKLSGDTFPFEKDLIQTNRFDQLISHLVVGVAEVEVAGT